MSTGTAAATATGTATATRAAFDLESYLSYGVTGVARGIAVATKDNRACLNGEDHL